MRRTLEDILPGAARGPGPADRPALIVVGGRPGAGKSTLSRRLAGALSCPLVSRDEINEGLRHTFRRHPAGASKGEVARAAFDTFFRTVELLVTARVSIVAEAAFQDRLWRLGLEPLLPAVDLRLVHCVLTTEAADDRIRRRRAERAAAHRPGTPPPTGSADTGWPPGRPFEPLSLPAPTLRVDTTDGYHPPFDAVVAFALGDDITG